jgi:hypothetical protein
MGGGNGGEGGRKEAKQFRLQPRDGSGEGAWIAIFAPYRITLIHLFLSEPFSLYCEFSSIRL